MTDARPRTHGEVLFARTGGIPIEDAGAVARLLRRRREDA